MNERTPTPTEKIIIRNQRYMMLALTCLLRNEGGMATGYHADKLTQRVQHMERIYDWIAAPSERLDT